MLFLDPDTVLWDLGQSNSASYFLIWKGEELKMRNTALKITGFCN